MVARVQPLCGPWSTWNERAPVALPGSTWSSATTGSTGPIGAWRSVARERLDAREVGVARGQRARLPREDEARGRAPERHPVERAGPRVGEEERVVEFVGQVDDVPGSSLTASSAVRATLGQDEEAALDGPAGGRGHLVRSSDPCHLRA